MYYKRAFQVLFAWFIWKSWWGGWETSITRSYDHVSSLQKTISMLCIFYFSFYFCLLCVALLCHLFDYTSVSQKERGKSHWLEMALFRWRQSFPKSFYGLSLQFLLFFNIFTLFKSATFLGLLLGWHDNSYFLFSIIVLSTFGGNPLASAVAIASLEVIKDERLAERYQFHCLLLHHQYDIKEVR